MVNVETAGDTGRAMHDRIARLYPICRSLTGDGVRRTLDIIGEELPLTIHEVPTGTPAFDWRVPREWNIREAYIKGPSGETVVDFRASNLHVVGYSVPVHAFMPLEALRPHLFTLPQQPELVPYRTAYYAEQWGFCLPHEQLERLPDGIYEVCIDSSLEDGHLTYGEHVLPGAEEREVLVSVHVCHPSLCNDNLSGISVAVQLARTLATWPRRYTYRFLFIPATIGSLTWLSRNEDAAQRIAAGLVLACVGDAGRPTYKRSRRGSAAIDRAMAHVLAHSGSPYEVRPFAPWGYDERQYCSPGFNLPVGLLSRTPHGEFPEYHTSADNLELVTPDALADTWRLCLDAFDVLEREGTYLNTHPYGEPQLGRRGLYRQVAGQSRTPEEERALLWMLNLSDGTHSVLDIAERAGLRFSVLADAADRLAQHGLVAPSRAATSSSTTRSVYEHGLR